MPPWLNWVGPPTFAGSNWFTWTKRPNIGAFQSIIPKAQTFQNWFFWLFNFGFDAVICTQNSPFLYFHLKYAGEKSNMVQRLWSCTASKVVLACLERPQLNDPHWELGKSQHIKAICKFMPIRWVRWLQ